MMDVFFPQNIPLQRLWIFFEKKGKKGKGKKVGAIKENMH